MSDAAPPIVGDLKITVTDPIKTDVDMVTSYVSYKVNVETTMSCFSDRQFTVIRRYSDFAWLRTVLLHNMPGVIVPPLPEKAVMHRFTSEFIESRRRALERFMSRCAEHSFIRENEIFRTFLKGSTDELSRCKTEQKKATSGGSSVLGSMTGAVAALAVSTSAQEKIKSPEDIKMDEVSAYVANLEAQMTNVAKHTAALMKRGKELSQGLFDFGLAFTMLSQHEAEALSGALSQMGHTADQLSLVAADHVEKEQRWFEEPITEYLALLGAVKEAVDRRAAVRKAYFAAAADVEAKAAAVQKLKAAGTPAADGKVPVAEAAVAAAEAAEAVAKESLVEVTARLLGEVARFKRVKADEMRKVVLDYVQLQIEYNKQMEQRWADLVPQIEAIQVEALPKVPIFDGALPKWASKPAAEGSGAVV